MRRLAVNVCVTAECWMKPDPWYIARSSRGHSAKASIDVRVSREVLWVLCSAPPER